MVVNRREMMKGSLALGAAGIAVSGRVAAAADDGMVVVIGAGLAGLSAARHLQSRGHKVVVLEARQQAGGRIRTSLEWPGMAMDLGASWIHGVRGNPLTALADAAGAKRVSTSYDRSVMITSGQERGDADYWYRRSERLVGEARQRAERLERDISLAEAIAALPRWQGLAREERRFISHCLTGSAELEYGGSLSELSAWYFDEAKEFGGADQLFPNGFGELIDHLARGLDVRFGERVVSLSPIAGGVEITTASGGRLRAAHAVVTLPLGVLQEGDTSFGEPLSPARSRAIETIGMGLLNKCWLRFERPVWPDDVDWLEYVDLQAPAGEAGFSQWVSMTRAAGLPVLLAFNGATRGRELEKLPDGEMAALAHEALRDMFGNRFPAPSAIQVTRWSREEMARGSYSFNSVGTTPQMREDLFGAEWGGRLVFAGEAASRDHFGTAHGAYLSGERAAKLLTRS